MKTKIDLTCPKCGATLSVASGRDTLFCEYCGAKILLNDENTYTIRNIDEAKLKQAETEQIAMLKKFEMAEKRAEAAQKKLKLKIKASIILAVVGTIMLIIGFLGWVDMFSLLGLCPIMGIAYIWFVGNDSNDSDDLGDRVKVPSSVSDFETKNYTAIEAILKSAGFKNVKCVPLNDLTMGFIKKPGMVASITINGHEITSGGKKFSPDASVVISYHSFAGR